MTAKQISTRQFVVVQFLISLAVKMFMLPALMLRVVGKDSYLVMLLWIAFEFIDLTFVLMLARRNPDKTMYDILTDAFGKIVSRVIVAIFTLFVAFKGLLVLGELKTFFVVTMYADINWFVMLLPLMALLCAFGLRSLRSIGRTAEIMAPVIVVSTLVLSGLLLGDIEFGNLLPFMENGFAPVKKGLLTFPMWFGDVSFLLMFLGNIKISHGFIWKSYLSKLVASALVMLFSVTLFSTYANVSTLIDYGNNVSNMTQLSMGAQDNGRFDLMFYCLWLFTVFIKLALIFYFFTRNLGFIAGTRNNYLTSLLCAAAWYILSAFVLKNENVSYLFFTGPVKYALCPVAFAMPLLLYITALVKYRPNYPQMPVKKEKKSDGCKKSEEQRTPAQGL